MALTLRVSEAAGYNEPRDSISHDWLDQLAAWGMTSLLVPNIGAEAPAMLDDLRADVLVLTGGDDLGDTPVRDETEARLLDHVLARGTPVLGVCRGMQLINTHFGGRLGAVDGHVGKPHAVAIAPPWRALYGEVAIVNSFHGLGVPADGVGRELRVAATDDAGGVEGLYHPEKSLAAVMWHPERPGAPAGDRQLLSALAKGKAPWRRRP